MNKIIRLVHKGTGGQKGWIYSIKGVAPTIPATSYKDPPLIVLEGKENEQKQYYSNREYKERD